MRWVAWFCVVVGLGSLAYGGYDIYSTHRTLVNMSTAFILISLGCSQLAMLSAQTLDRSIKKEIALMACAMLSGLLGIVYLILYPQSVPQTYVRWLEGIGLAVCALVAVLWTIRRRSAQ